MLATLRNWAHAGGAVLAWLMGAQAVIVTTAQAVETALGFTNPHTLAVTGGVETAVFGIAAALLNFSKSIDSTHNRTIVAAHLNALATPGISLDAVTAITRSLAAIVQHNGGQATAP